jgi:hypothetical protein
MKRKNGGQRMEVSKELASSLEVGDGGYGVVDDGLRSSLEAAWK